MLSKTYTKYIQSLHLKKYRDTEAVFIAEGSKVVMDLLKSGQIVCETLIGKQDWLHSHEPELREYFAGPLQIAEDFELAKISALATPNQVLGVFRQLRERPATLTGSITLVLDTIQDPGNLGTIIRTADWFGVQHIVCSRDCADIYNPKVVQSTMGSIARVNLWYADILPLLNANPLVPVYAAVLAGSPVTALHGVEEAILVIGNESKGISPAVMERANIKITIPKFGGAESLNAAVATGILLSHLKL